MSTLRVLPTCDRTRSKLAYPLRWSLHSQSRVLSMARPLQKFNPRKSLLKSPYNANKPHLPPLPSNYRPFPFRSASESTFFWFLSLTSRLATGLIGILCVHWLREFKRDPARSHKNRSCDSTNAVLGVTTMESPRRSITPTHSGSLLFVDTILALTLEPGVMSSPQRLHQKPSNRSSIFSPKIRTFDGDESPR